MIKFHAFILNNMHFVYFFDNAFMKEYSNLKIKLNTNFSSDSKLCVLRNTTSGGFNSLLSDDGTIGCLNSLVVFPIKIKDLLISK